MNRYNRKEIENIIDTIEELKNDLEVLLSEEQEKRDNMPENLEFSECVEVMDNAISNLDEAISNIDEVLSNLHDILGY